MNQNPLTTAVNSTPTGKNRLSLNEHSRLVILENTINKGRVTFIEVGNAMIEIREHELWRDKYKSFDDYCETRWGWGRTRSQQIIGAATAIQKLTPENVTIVTNEAVARAVKQVPEAKRNEVVAKASTVAKARNTPVTAKIVREVSSKQSAQDAGKPLSKDDTGYVVPEAALAFWERRFEVKALIESVQQVRAEVMVAWNHGKESDLLFFGKGKLAQTFITDLENVIRHLKAIMPYAVCPYCQGKLMANCAYCNKTGVIDRDRFNASPAELLALREKSTKTTK